jgi:signal peptidase II
VVDFLELPYNWPVFNLADTAVVSAAVLMVLQTLRGVGLDGRRTKS